MKFTPWKKKKSSPKPAPLPSDPAPQPTQQAEELGEGSDAVRGLAALMALKVDEVEKARPASESQKPTAGSSAAAAAKPIKPPGEREQDRSLYKAILASLYDAILIVDANGSVIASNGRAEQFFGYSEGEFWNRPCGTLVAGFNPKVFAKIRNHISAGRFTVLNANCMRQNGESFPAEIAIGRIRYLNEGDLVLSVRNIERRKKGDERRELELYAARHTCVGLMICRHDGLIEYVNPTAVRLLQGESEHRILQRMLGDFCEAETTVREILQAPGAATTWTGRVTLLTCESRLLDVAASSALCPVRKDGLRRVVLSLMPVPKSTVQ